MDAVDVADRSSSRRARSDVAKAAHWARRTRDAAVLGVAFFPLAIVALWRVLGPLPAVEASATARRHLRQATVLSLVGVGLALAVLGVTALA